MQTFKLTATVKPLLGSSAVRFIAYLGLCLEFDIGFLTDKNDVANDQQRPAITKDLQARVHGIIPGEDRPLAGTHRGHARLEALLRKASETMETTFPAPLEFVAQGDHVLVIGFAQGSIKTTGRKWEDHWVFAITVRDAKLTHIQEYIDTQALAA